MSVAVLLTYAESATLPRSQAHKLKLDHTHLFVFHRLLQKISRMRTGSDCTSSNPLPESVSFSKELGNLHYPTATASLSSVTLSDPIMKHLVTCSLRVFSSPGRKRAGPV